MEHPIKSLMKTAMESIRHLVDVNTTIGEPIELPNEGIVIPISKVGFGFAAGGSEFTVDPKYIEEQAKEQQPSSDRAYPFGGGSGGGVSITPIAFLVVKNDEVKVISLDHHTHILDRIIDSAPQFIDQIQHLVNGNDREDVDEGRGVTEY